MELHANEYRSSAPFTIQDPDGGPDFTITQSSINQTRVGAYPKLFVGCNYGFCTKNNPFPLQLSSIKPGEVTSSVTSVTPSTATGRWAHFYDIFLTPGPHQSQGTTPREELVILQNEHNRGQGTPIATNVNLDGKPYDISICNICAPHTVVYVPQSMTGSFSGDLLPFFQDSIRRGYAQPSWYLINVENGFEISNGNVVGLGDANFSVQVGGG